MTCGDLLVPGNKWLMEIICMYGIRRQFTLRKSSATSIFTEVIDLTTDDHSHSMFGIAHVIQDMASDDIISYPTTMENLKESVQLDDLKGCRTDY
jgi:hypothetical protein